VVVVVVLVLVLCAKAFSKKAFLCVWRVCTVCVCESIFVHDQICNVELVEMLVLKKGTFFVVADKTFCLIIFAWFWRHYTTADIGIGSENCDLDDSRINVITS